jgi:hypothetical protein
MIAYDPQVLIYWALNGAQYVRNLFSITVTDPSDNSEHSLHLWQGNGTFTTTIDGVERTYVGTGTLMDFDPIREEMGFTVQEQQISFGTVPIEVQQMVKQYDASRAPLTIHSAKFDANNGTLLAEPDRIFKGFSDHVNIPDGAENTDTVMRMTAKDVAYSLTTAVHTKKSNASQKRVNPLDEGKSYASVSSGPGEFWGTVDKKELEIPGTFSSGGGSGQLPVRPVAPVTPDTRARR